MNSQAISTAYPQPEAKADPEPTPVALAAPGESQVICLFSIVFDKFS